MLRIRYIQLKRSFAGLPLLYWVIILGLIAYVFYGLFIKMNNYSFSLAVTLITPIAILSLHFLRRDHRFLNILSTQTYKIYFQEYFCLISPILILLSLNQHWLLVIILLSALVLMITVLNFIPFQTLWRPISFFTFPLLLHFIPPFLFEWRSGFRRSGIQVLVIYSLALGLSFLPFASLFLLALLTFVMSGFYTDGESLSILNAGLLSPKEFLQKKIFVHCKYTSIGLLPVLGVYFVQHPADWYFIPIAWCVYMVNIVYFITLKYALYRPDKKLVAETVWTAILFVSTLIPFLFPMPFLIAHRNYSLAKINLKSYLDDRA